MTFVKGLLVTLLILVILVVSIDRIANWRAERVLSDRLASNYQLGPPPEVQIKGTSFLLQWASGSYSEVDVTEPQVVSQGVEVTNASAQLHQVSFSPFALSINDLRAARAESLEASGILPYAELPVPQGLQLEPEGSQLRLHGTANSAGGQITISVLIRPVIDQGRLLLKVDQVDAPNPFLKPIISSMVEKSFQGISQPPLPLGLALSGAQVGPVGLTLSANSNQVSLGGS